MHEPKTSFARPDGQSQTINLSEFRREPWERGLVVAVLGWREFTERLELLQVRSKLVELLRRVNKRPEVYRVRDRNELLRLQVEVVTGQGICLAGVTQLSALVGQMVNDQCFDLDTTFVDFLREKIASWQAEAR
jgi:hypothetical protein